MKKYIFVGAMCFSTFIAVQKVKAQAQTNLMSIEVDGVRAKDYNTAEIEGSPFLNEEWIAGTATNNTTGETYNVSLKYDIAIDKLIFRGKDDGAMNFTVPISSFKLGDDSYSNGFPAVDDWNATTYYKVMGAGKNKLLRHFYKKKQTVRDIGGLLSYKYEDIDIYYLLKDGKMTSIKPNKGNLLDALSDKKEKVEAFAKQNKINFKNDADLAKLMDYYNSI